MKKVVRIVILSVFAFCLSIACKNYTEDIEDYLSYWSAGVSIAEYRFEPQPQIYTEGMQYVSSKAPVTVTFTVHNSKNLNLKMPGDSDAPADIISFPHIPDAPDKRVAAPQSGNDYEFKKISNTELKLTYNPAFLQKYEWGRGDITPSIILYTTDGRVFKQNIPFKLNVNTPPPAIAECVIGQTETAPPSETCYYVLCLQLSDDDMKKTCGNGLLHGDIAGVEINGTIYNLSVDRKLKQLKAQPGSPFIDKDKVKKLDTIDAKEIPSDWTLYFKTEVEVKLDSPKTEYTVKLKDAKGLYSEPVTVGTQGKIVTVTFKLAGGNISGSAADITRTGAPGASFTAPANPTKDGYTFNDWNPPLPTPPVFPAADTTYTAQWQEIPKPGMRIKEGISAEEKSYGESGTDDLVPNAEHHTNTNPLIIYKESGQAKLSITGSSDTTAYYRIDAGSETQGTEINLSADGNAHKLTVWAKKGTDDSIKTVLYVQVKDALTTYKELKNVVTHADDNAVIMVKNIIAASSAAGNNGEIVINKNITIQGTNKTSETLNAGSFSRIFRVKDGKTLTLQNITLTGGNTQHEQGDKNGGGVYIENGSCTMDNVLVVECTADAGGAVYVKDSTFSISGSTRITPSTGEYEQTAGKNDVYLKGGKLITVTGTLTGTTPIARITPENYPAGSTAVKVLDGAAVTTEYTKFKVTDEAPTKKWKINASGNLEAVGGQGITANTWRSLRKAVEEATDDTVIEITGNCIYDPDEETVKSLITVNKNITIQSAAGHKYTLNAGGSGLTGITTNKKITGIFEVTNGKVLKLKDLVLTMAETYAVSVNPGSNSLEMEQVTITNCKTKEYAASIYFNEGKNLMLTGCTIEECRGTGSASSGGMYIQEPKGTITIKDTTIKNCESQRDGGGIRLSKANCTLTNVIIQECKAPKGGGMCVNAGTLTITGGSFTKNEATGTGTDIQGGAIYSEGGRLTLKSCMIGGDNSGDGNRAKKGGGIYLKNVALTMQSVTVKNNKALTQGAGIYLAAGELKIPGGNTIANNSIIDNGNSEAGGGIYVEKGMLTLDGGSIDGNSANANKGGGVHLKAGTFTMNSGEIKNCSAKYGGGVSPAGKSSFTMTGGSITECKADGEGGVGGGIYTTLKTQLTLEGHDSNPIVISNCTAKKAGGGMLIHTNNPVTFKNARIEGNTAENGGGVYLEQGTFTIAGSTRITPSAGKNDVFLKGGKFIMISDSLTAETPIARITPENYTAGVKVLQAPSTECAKFTVTPNSEGSWSIKSDGTLKKQ